MNWSKNLYVFMLGALIVFSGCIGTGTTDGEGDADAGTTVINNYYNNTTEVITEIPEKIALGGFVNGDCAQAYCDNLTATINTNAGQMLTIEEVRVTCEQFCTIDLDMVCTDGVNFDLGRIAQSNSDPLSIQGANMPGSAFDCTHSISIIDGTSVYQEIYWSFVYSIGPVTVG